MENNPVTFPSADGQAALHGWWHLPTRRATNGALIVLHRAGGRKEDELYERLSRGAAGLGLSALRFDFRYAPGDLAGFDPVRQGADDLRGAYNFFQSFGKEIKPARYYLIGHEQGGVAALRLACEPDLAHVFTGLTLIDLPLEPELTFDLSRLKAPALLILQRRDTPSGPDLLNRFCGRLPGGCEQRLVEQAGSNPDEVVEITLEWLEQADAIRPDLRK